MQQAREFERSQKATFMTMAATADLMFEADVRVLNSQ